MNLNYQFQPFDQTKAQMFSNEIISALNQGALCILLSIGHRTQLLDSMDGQGPLSSHNLAKQTGLNERYVREWLNGMVVSKVVEYEPASQTYFLPQEHADFLTRRSSQANLAVYAQYIPMMGGVEDHIIDSFENGGGVSYDKFPRFHEVMAEDSNQTVLSSLVEHILPLVPGLIEKLEKGINVLDLGCGRGRALNLLALLYPNSNFVGMELSWEAINYAKKEARRLGNHNVKFQARSATNFHETAPEAEYDLITTFDAIHDQAKPFNVIKGIHKALKDDGVYLMQDIHSSSEVQNNMDHPVGPLLYAISLSHCMSVSLHQGGEGLGTMWGQEKAKELLQLAGFKDIRIEQLAHDFQNDYYIIGK